MTTPRCIQSGQIYAACHPLDEGRRIRIVGEPMTIPGVWGFGKATVETLDENGRGTRQRSIDVSQLHPTATTKTGAPRRTGYALETQ